MKQLDEIDQVMERASQALAQMDYLAAEVLCLEALRMARAAGQWCYYARILLPLQEARRQRRMIAAEGVIRLGTARLSRLSGGPDTWLDAIDAGCIVVTHPHTAADARDLERAGREQHRYIEVLFADNAPAAERWMLRAHAGPDVRCSVAGPPTAWRDNRLPPGEGAGLEGDEGEPASGPVPEAVAGRQGRTPADWFIDATEALGDAALAQVAAAPGDPARIEQLEQMLEVVTDHEILHQRLGDAARAMPRSEA